MDDDIVWKVECPMCQSDNTNESIMAQGREIWVEKECNDCGVEWIDFYTYSGMDFIQSFDS